MAKQFEPKVTVLQPQAASKDDHLGTVAIDTGDQRVNVLFFGEDGGMRFRIYHSPMVISECYLQGGKNKFTVVRVKPGT